MAAAALRRFARTLHPDPDGRYSQVPKDLEVRARHEICPAETYVEDEPTVLEWLRECVPTRDGAVSYAWEVFPVSGWLRRYNWRWLRADIIAGESAPRLGCWESE